MRLTKTASDRDWDIMIRVTALETVLGGRRWPRDARGLEAAEIAAAEQGLDIDPEWFERGDTGIYSALKRKARMMKSEQDAEDILMDLFAGKGEGAAASHPNQTLGYIAESMGADIRSGSGAVSEYKGKLMGALQNLGIDLIRRYRTRWREQGKEVSVTPGPAGRGDNIVPHEAPSATMFSVKTEMDKVITLMRDPTTGRVLRQWLREVWSGPEFTDAEKVILMYRLDNPLVSQTQIGQDLGVKKQRVTNVLSKAKRVSEQALSTDRRMSQWVDTHIEMQDLGFTGRTASERMAARVAFRTMLAAVVDLLCR